MWVKRKEVSEIGLFFHIYWVYTPYRVILYTICIPKYIIFILYHISLCIINYCKLPKKVFVSYLLGSHTITCNFVHYVIIIHTYYLTLCIIFEEQSTISVSQKGSWAKKAFVWVCKGSHTKLAQSAFCISLTARPNIIYYDTIGTVGN